MPDRETENRCTNCDLKLTGAVRTFCDPQCRADFMWVQHNGSTTRCGNRECRRVFKSVGLDYCGRCEVKGEEAGGGSECATPGCAATVREGSEFCTLRCFMLANPEPHKPKAWIEVHG